jgi:hypothetical protein
MGKAPKFKNRFLESAARCASKAQGKSTFQKTTDLMRTSTEYEETKGRVPSL